MQVKNYTSVAVLAKIDNEAEFELMRIGHYFAIIYKYPKRMRIIKYKNLIEACEDFVKRLRILAKNYNIKLIQKGELFIRSPNEIIL